MNILATSPAPRLSAPIQPDNKQANSNDFIPGKTHTPPGPANIARSKETFSGTALSGEVNSVLFRQQELIGPDTTKSTVSMNTSKGNINLNLENYFAGNTGPVNSLQDVTLLMPTADNVKALSKHASTRFRQLLQDYNIPVAPDTLTYNQEGRMILPSDYPYTKELKQALNENPGIKRELSTLNAITSQYAELQKLQPFHNEYSGAGSPADIQATIDKYSHLLWGNRQNSTIALSFTENNSLKLLIDGVPLKNT